MSSFLVSAEHAVASVAHGIVVGAKATVKVLAKIESIAEKESPVIEAVTGLIDPRAEQIERLGAALLGAVEPQIVATANQIATDASTVTVALPFELVNDVRVLLAALGPEIAAAKASVAATASK